MLENIKTFLASPEGAPAIIGMLRAIFTVLIGVGVAVTAEQVESAIALATSLIAIMNIVMSLFTVRTVRVRADTEEAEAALSGDVLATNGSDLLV